MSKSVFQILDQLSAMVEELRAGLAPLAVLASGATTNGRVEASAVPAASRKRRGPGKKKAAAAAAPAPAPKVKPAAKKTEAKKSKGGAKKAAKSSGAVSEGRQLQGRYMGVLRNLTAEQKANVKKVREEKGIEAAIKAATAIGGK